MKNIYFILYIYIYFSSLEIKKKKKCMSLKPMFFVLRVELCVFAETLVERKKRRSIMWRWIEWGVNCWLCGRPVCKQTDRQAAEVLLVESSWRTERRGTRGDGWPDLQSPSLKPSPPLPFLFPPPPLPSALPPLPKTTVPLVCRTLRRKRWILLLFFFKGILHWIIWKVTTDSYGNPELKLTS